MKAKIEKTLLTCLALFALFHLVNTIIYLAPNNPLTSGKLGAFSKSYMEPAFAQKWSFFSPRPGIEDVSFEYKCFENNELAPEWIDLEKDRLFEHQNNHFLGLGRVLYLTKILSEELLRRYELQLKSCFQEKMDKKACTAESKKTILLSKEFFYTHTLFTKKCPKEEKDGYQFRVKVTKPIQFSKREEIEKRDLTFVEFPIIPYKKSL